MVFEEFVTLTIQLMNVLTIKFMGKLMLKIADLKLFTFSILISTGVTESFEEKMSTYTTLDA